MLMLERNVNNNDYDDYASTLNKLYNFSLPLQQRSSNRRHSIVSKSLSLYIFYDYSIFITPWYCYPPTMRMRKTEDSYVYEP